MLSATRMSVVSDCTPDNAGIMIVDILYLSEPETKSYLALRKTECYREKRSQYMGWRAPFLMLSLRDKMFVIMSISTLELRGQG